MGAIKNRRAPSEFATTFRIPSGATHGKPRKTAASFFGLLPNCRRRAKDTGETDWKVADTDGDGVNDYLEYLLGRNGVVAGVTNDVNGVINLRLYTPLK